jgi:hypothetical protein
MTVKTKAGDDHLNYMQALSRFRADGGYPSFKVQEDIITSEKAGLGRVTDRIMESKIGKAASHVSEAEGVYFRLAQYHQLMSDVRFTKNFRNTEEASHAAMSKVQKTHPDSQGLSQFDRKYSRRVFPFYSFFRQVIPTVFNTMLDHPARLTALPKIQQGVQQSLGYNPEDLEDPFDPTKRYPSFITDFLSGPMPIGSFEGITNLGTPLEAANEMFPTEGGPGAYLANALNPVIKTPIELISGEKASFTGDGTYIADKSETLDRAIPFLGPIADILKKSPTGTLGNVVSGTPELDPQRSAAINDATPVWNESLLNALLGIGYQSLDKETYRRRVVNEDRGNVK